MRTALASIATIGILASFSVASAQENQPQPGTYCPHLTQDLKRGDRNSNTNGQVTELQKFLTDYYDLNPETYITGYFGRLTQANVIRFQREQNLPAFGYVGPLTRAAIARVCGTTTTPPPPPTNPPLPTCTLNVNPSTITTGQSATLSWTSTNAAGGTITSIGTVSQSGSQSVSPTITATYTGSFGTYNALATCSATITVTSQTASCTLDGVTMQHNSSYTFYSSKTWLNGKK